MLEKPKLLGKFKKLTLGGLIKSIIIWLQKSQKE
jgi:hypothetical protein